MTYEKIARRLAGITVKSLDGKDIAFDSLWKDRKAVVAFLRHFG